LKLKDFPCKISRRKILGRRGWEFVSINSLF
jgi:hypothetical protein